MKKKIDSLTGLRAIASLWVVLFHINYTSTLHHTLGPVIANGTFGVDVFFVLSGFVLSMVYASRLPLRFSRSWYRKFIVRRFAKIYPIHLLTFLLMVALIISGRHLHFNFVGTERNSLWSAFCNVFLIHSMGLTKRLSWNIPSWSVSAEWFAYAVIFTPMAFLGRRIRTAFVVIVAVLLWAVFLLACKFLFNSGIDLTTTGALRILPEFVSGYALWRALEKRTLSHGDLVAASGLLLLLAICYLPADFKCLLLPAIVLLIAGLYSGGAVCDCIFGSKAAVLFGDCSYSIYLTHAIVLIGMNLLANRIPWLHRPLPFLILALPTIAVTGLITFWYVEEPIRKWLVQAWEPTGPNPESTSPPTIPGLAPDTQVSSTAG